jgi:hypothetical protein
MIAYGGKRGINPFILYLDTGWSEWSDSRPIRFTSERSTLGTHSVTGWMGPRLDLDAMEKKAISYPVDNRRGQLKCDGTRAETRFRLSAKRTSPFKSAGASVQSTTGSQSVRISGSNAGYTTCRGSVKGTGYPLHSPVSPSLPLPCVTMCHHISTGVYHNSDFAVPALPSTPLTI